MENAIAWIPKECGDSNWTPIPLLGGMCRAHSERTLAEAGISCKQEERELVLPFETLVLVRADAPCLHAAELRRLADAVSQEDAMPKVLKDENERETLALALPYALWQGALRKYGHSPSETAAMLLNEENDENVSVLPPCGAGNKTRFRVMDGQSYARALGILQSGVIQKHMQAGVIFLDPTHALVEMNVTIGAGTMVYPGNTVQGHTRIGANCILYPGNRMQNAVIGENTTVENSVLAECTVGKYTTVGPFAYLRPQTAVGDHCRIGDFVEIKNSDIGDGTKVSHLTYVGDSDLGKDINLGCGVVFVNYDGKAKHRCRVGDQAFIGCNSNLVAPVHIGSKAYVAAGSTITEDVPDEAMYIARSRGVVKEGWVQKRRERGEL